MHNVKVVRANTCKTCKFRHTDPGEPTGRCHEGPPQRSILVNPLNGTISENVNFPLAPDDWWCWRHKPKILQTGESMTLPSDLEKRLGN